MANVFVVTLLVELPAVIMEARAVQAEALAGYVERAVEGWDGGNHLDEWVGVQEATVISVGQKIFPE
jgi:hypothetical protein